MKQVELNLSLVKLTFRAVLPFLSVRIAPIYACILKALTAGDDFRIQYSSN